MAFLKLFSFVVLLFVVHSFDNGKVAAQNPEYWDLPDCSAARIKQLLYRVCIMFKRSATFFSVPFPVGNELEFMQGTPRQHFTKVLGRYFRTALTESEEDDLIGPVLQRYPTRYYLPSGSINATSPLARYFSMNAFQEPDIGTRMGLGKGKAKMMYYLNKYDEVEDAGKGIQSIAKGGRFKRSTDENSLANRIKKQIETLIASCCSASGCNKMDFIRLEEMYPICNTPNDIGK